MDREGNLITRDNPDRHWRITKYDYEQLSHIMVNPPSPSNPAKSGWLDLINESVHYSDDIDIGDIHAINRDFVVVKKRFCERSLLLYSYYES